MKRGAYLAHSLLGPRLDRCTRIVLDQEESSLRQMFGTPDDIKFQSSMTLLALAAADQSAPFIQSALFIKPSIVGVAAPWTRKPQGCWTRVTAAADHFGSGVLAAAASEKFAARGESPMARGGHLKSALTTSPS
jgi:hypothetical protein